MDQIKVGTGIAVSDPMRNKKKDKPVDKPVDKVDKPIDKIDKPVDKVDKPTDKSKEKKKEDPNELKSPTIFQSKEQKVVAKERKKSVDIKASEEQIAEPAASPLKFDFNGKLFVMLLDNLTLKEAVLKINTKLSIKSCKLFYIDGEDKIDINDEDDWQTVLQLKPRPKISVSK